MDFAIKMESTLEYTEEQLNFFRMVFIIFDIIPVGLRSVFRQEWDYRYKRSMGRKWTNTKVNGDDFYHKEEHSCREERKCHLDKIKKGNTTEWDSSCLFFAILFSNSIGCSPNPLKRNVKDSVHTLRTVRNDIVHINEAKLTDYKFENYVERVIRAFRNLGLTVKNMAMLQQKFKTTYLALDSTIKRRKTNHQKRRNRYGDVADCSYNDLAIIRPSHIILQ